jgi:hypothetical protein
MASLLIGVSVLPLPAWITPLSQFLPLHTLLETIAIVIAMLVFAVGWNSHSNHSPGNDTLLSCLFLGVGLLDFSHVLSFLGMPAYVTPSDPEKAINFWLAARLLAAIAILISAIGGHQLSCSNQHRYRMLFGVLSLTGAAHWLFLTQPELLPRTFVQESGLTAFKIGFEYTLIIFNLISAALLYQRSKTPQSSNPTTLLAAVSAMALSELCFTLYTSFTDVYILLGHFYKVIAYFYLYRALFVTAIERPYQRLQQSQEELLQKNALIYAIIDGTSDAIYAKKTDSTYVLFKGISKNCH